MVKRSSLLQWNIGHVSGWLVEENLSPLGPAFMKARANGVALKVWNFDKIHAVAENYSGYLTHELASAIDAFPYQRLMQRFGIERSPDGVITHVLDESSPPHHSKGGEDNSRWEPELDNGTKVAVIAKCSP